MENVSASCGKTAGSNPAVNTRYFSLLLRAVSSHMSLIVWYLQRLFLSYTNPLLLNLLQSQTSADSTTLEEINNKMDVLLDISRSNRRDIKKISAALESWKPSATCVQTGAPFRPALSKEELDKITTYQTVVLLPACLPPLLCADKFVLVGDSQQLPPVVQSSQARCALIRRLLARRLPSKVC
ncbi:hypothetical protein FHG87_010599 [Trinorchestia longiramus]|nr:hypothetical protein FHG87_010599 [Trinorchestia longiramus]